MELIGELVFKRKRQKYLFILLCLAILSSLQNQSARAGDFEMLSSEVSCAPYIFLGLSGSGQKSDLGESGLNREFGPEIASLYGSINQIPEFKGQITYDSVSAYKAIGLPRRSENLARDLTLFIKSLNSNASSALNSRFKEYETACPNSRFIVAGYSQGAYAAHRFILDLEKTDSSKLNKIIGAIFLANPATPKTGIISFLNPSSVAASSISKLANSFRMLLCSVLRLRAVSAWCSNSVRSGVKVPGSVERLPSPKSIKTLFFYRDFDIIADTANLFSTSNLTKEINLAIERNSASSKTVPKLNQSALFAAGVSVAASKGIGIHSSYCPTGGEFAPKSQSKKRTCNPENNSLFLQESLKYLTAQVATVR